MGKIITLILVGCIFWLSSAYAINWGEVDKIMDDAIQRVDQTVRHEELLVCPFCGSPGEADGRYHGRVHFIKGSCMWTEPEPLYTCSNKECPTAETSYVKTEWNTRSR